MGRRVWRPLNDSWNTVLNKQVYRKEKLFSNREARLQNATSFFISNLPDSCDKFSLWKAFEHFDNLEDAFVPVKKDRAGNRFGFIKLSNVTDSAWWIEKLKEVRIDGAIIGVNLARFNRDGSKVERQNKVRISVFNRLDGLNPPQKAPRVAGKMDPIAHGSKSYSAVVSKSIIEVPGGSIPLPPMNSELKKSLEFKSLVGEVKDIDFLNDLKDLLMGITEEGVGLKYLGGLKVLLCFSSPAEAEEFRCDKVEIWERWFSRLYIWEGIPPVFERVAWVKILGVPVSLWDRTVFNKIGERCGKLLVKSEAEVNDGNVSEERLAILVHSGKRFSAEFNLQWKENNIPVWVEEIVGQWSPSFLEGEVLVSESADQSSEFGDSPATSKENSKSFREDRSVGCMGNSDGPDDCMGNSVGSSVHVFEEVHDEGDVHGDLSQPHSVFNEERESSFQNVNVGPGEPLSNLDNGLPSPSEECRPSFITVRPKRFLKPLAQEPVICVPDLNVTGERAGR
ncbi:putative RNA recognition motif domain, nucleotide-binding alpha-beta plait domain superfamily [Helianthus annuus]|uniref:RNA recognition motif domain, nucleotide-binding alpha-beta plait domain superfamily n=1 Tax=Helianthus annuus TaxID=4232 RepID=A0A9K3P0N3_HELAN|nr:putative RNA recognition motif domain, nucleotide-binding alpha-beta plait domain superfamily [Helianthus annuus]KAJ0604394.1 putative RNA recognition motif domain, nucleotide-binding alpha-beta plait domain superfamily [Helianthus annuus]KAJ0618424.1 putative RNA recognition motif domain, nucleotide-binding alpha-beta plait domain superfamily [Helianthus annuus]KAJ0939487.1 putative RNA recognition motif domain, nucleotide-binding alpha-beta plait domain superfamily [Helianthus annuus]